MKNIMNKILLRLIFIFVIVIFATPQIASAACLNRNEARNRGFGEACGGRYGQNGVTTLCSYQVGGETSWLVSCVNLPPSTAPQPPEGSSIDVKATIEGKIYEFKDILTSNLETGKNKPASVQVSGNPAGVSVTSTAAPSSVDGKTIKADAMLQMKWQPVNGATGYLVTIAETSKQDVIVSRGDVKTASHTFSNLKPNTNYHWCVTAYNKAGQSAPSCFGGITGPASVVGGTATAVVKQTQAVKSVGAFFSNLGNALIGRQTVATSTSCPAINN
jgi:hypothetical protein